MDFIRITGARDEMKYCYTLTQTLCSSQCRTLIVYTVIQIEAMSISSLGTKQFRRVTSPCGMLGQRQEQQRHRSSPRGGQRAPRRSPSSRCPCRNQPWRGQRSGSGTHQSGILNMNIKSIKTNRCFSTFTRFYLDIIACFCN